MHRRFRTFLHLARQYVLAFLMYLQVGSCMESLRIGAHWTKLCVVDMLISFVRNMLCSWHLTCTIFAWRLWMERNLSKHILWLRSVISILSSIYKWVYLCICFNMWRLKPMNSYQAFYQRGCCVYAHCTCLIAWSSSILYMISCGIVSVMVYRNGYQNVRFRLLYNIILSPFLGAKKWIGAWLVSAKLWWPWWFSTERSPKSGVLCYAMLCQAIAMSWYRMFMPYWLEPICLCVGRYRLDHRECWLIHAHMTFIPFAGRWASQCLSWS